MAARASKAVGRKMTLELCRCHAMSFEIQATISVMHARFEWNDTSYTAYEGEKGI